ncbi:MAG: acyltransferase [Acidocella sp.]|nr:acyltransferase [Acidocella sp.]
MSRRDDIDRVKGFAIILVVLGHLVARADPLNVDWYEPMRRAIYAFHMPLFLYLSGMIAMHSGFLVTKRPLWLRVIRARAQRLLIPFFGLGILIVVAKLALGRFIYVDNPPAGLVSGLLDLFWNTEDSPALSIWYLFVLFSVSLITLVLVDARPQRLPWLLLGALLLYAVPLPAYMYLDRIGTYAVFFMFGANASRLGARWERFMARFWPGLLVMLASSIAVIVIYGEYWPERLILLPVGALSMPAIHGWLRFSPVSTSQILKWLGRNSFMIYFFNTMFIGLTKGIWLCFASWNGDHFIPLALLMTGTGLLGPISLKKLVFRRIRRLDRLTD